MERFGYSERELARGEVTDAFRELLAFEVQRTRELFHGLAWPSSTCWTAG